MIETYWRVGRRIVEEEQRGKERAEYGEQLINHLSARLTHEYGAGFSARYLRAFRKFYILMPDIEIWKSRFPNLTWTHKKKQAEIIQAPKTTIMARYKEYGYDIQNGKAIIPEWETEIKEEAFWWE